MSVSLVGVAPPPQYTNYSIVSFPSWRKLEKYANAIKEDNINNSRLQNAQSIFRNYINNALRDNPNSQFNAYGIDGKQPKSYQDAMDRNTFIYYDEYKKIKASVEKQVAEKLRKNSNAETMKPKLVYNDKEIGEFVYEKAAMALKPKIFYYSKKYERVIDIINENVITEGSVMILESDKSLVVFAFEVTKEDGEKEYVEIKGDGEESLNEARKKGIVSCTSSNKKVYLYKEKKPKIYNAVKIVVGMTAGGFTSWTNDFYTGITACVLVDVLESLGYSVAVEVALGGGRCGGCVSVYNS